jgi:hypothetical protein
VLLFDYSGKYNGYKLLAAISVIHQQMNAG